MKIIDFIKERYAISFSRDTKLSDWLYFILDIIIDFFRLGIGIAILALSYMYVSPFLLILLPIVVIYYLYNYFKNK